MAEENSAPAAETETAPAVEPAPVAAAPAVDQEKIALAKERDELRATLGQVADGFQSGKFKLAEQQAAPVVEEDDTALVDRKELKRREAELAQKVAGAIIQQTHVTARLTRANTKDLLRGQLKDFGKYEAEIDGILDKVADPLQAANPETIRKAYKIVRAEHLDEIEAELRAQAVTRGEDEEEVEAAPSSGSRIPGSMPSPGRSGVAPLGDASLSRGAAARHDAAVKPLSREEKVAAFQIFGGLFKDAAEYRKYQDPTWRPDILGSKGRTKF